MSKIDVRRTPLERSLRESRMCRICLCSDNEDDFITPCRCKGSSRLVHAACLGEWVEVTENPVAKTRCTVCETPYSLEPIKSHCFSRFCESINFSMIFLFLYLYSLSLTIATAVAPIVAFASGKQVSHPDIFVLGAILHFAACAGVLACAVIHVRRFSISICELVPACYKKFAIVALPTTIAVAAYPIVTDVRRHLIFDIVVVGVVPLAAGVELYKALARRLARVRRRFLPFDASDDANDDDANDDDEKNAIV